MAVAGGLAYSY